MKKQVFTFTLTYYQDCTDEALIASKLSDMTDRAREGMLNHYSEGLGYKVIARSEASDEN